MDLLSKKDFGILRLSFNRESKRNSLNVELCQTLRTQLENAQTDPDVRVVMLTVSKKYSVLALIWRLSARHPTRWTVLCKTSLMHCAILLNQSLLAFRGLAWEKDLLFCCSPTSCTELKKLSLHFPPQLLRRPHALEL